MAQTAQLLRLADVRAALSTGEAQRLREAADLSISEIARACGVDQSTVWRWERGTRRPRGEAALLYGQLIEDLRKRTESEPPTAALA
ncbi:helix-turn-helix transcriptional regulator [Streptomyces sp. NPDC005732]|uniref:helix-turn-helix domain-containing protein n=1 Tax=Streptomyces sp. NPDC005732 TaxID=3157057 RepID=UPI0033FDA395